VRRRVYSWEPSQCWEKARRENSESKGAASSGVKDSD